MLVEHGLLSGEDVRSDLWVGDPKRIDRLEVHCDYRILGCLEALALWEAHSFWKFAFHEPLIWSSESLWAGPGLAILLHVKTVAKEKALASWKENCSLLLVEREVRHCTQVEKEEDQEVKDG